MGGCFSTEGQNVPQNGRQAMNLAIRSSGNNPHRSGLPRPKPNPRPPPKLPKNKLAHSTPAHPRYHRPDPKTNTQRSYHHPTSKANTQRPRPRPSPKKNIQRSKSTESLASDLLRALEEIWVEEEEEEEEARRPKIPGNGTGRPPIVRDIEDRVLPLVPERPFSAPPTQGLGRHLSIISAPPQAEFPIMPELACPVLPPDGVFFDGYVPPVPKKIPLDHPPPAAAFFGGSAYLESDKIYYEEQLAHLETPIEPPQNPPKEFEGVPAPPQKPDSVQEELLPTGAAEDQHPQVANDKHPLAAELPSQRPTAELAGQLPSTELDSTLMANPVEEELRIKYRDAVPFSPNFAELPSQLLPARSASMYTPHLVGCEWEQDKAVPVMLARVASPVDEDEVYYATCATGAAYGIGR